MASHFLVLPSPLWGHSRPLLGICLDLLRLHPDLVITFLAHNINAYKISSEVTRFGLQKSEIERLRLVPFGGSKERAEKLAANVSEADLPSTAADAAAALATYYPKLLSCEALEFDDEHRTVIQPVPHRVNVIITDGLELHWVLPIKMKIEGALFGEHLPTKRSKYLTFMPLPTGYMLYIFGRFPISPCPELVQKAFYELKTPGNTNSIREIHNKYFAHNTDICQVPGYPPAYFYEWDPSRRPANDSWIEMTFGGIQIQSNSAGLVDGMILPWVNEIGPPEAQTMGDKTFTNLYQVGPQIPLPTRGLGSGEAASGGDVVAFLDKALEESGEHTVLYIGFGSQWFPPTLRDFEILLETLLELQIKFIMTEGALEDEAKLMLTEAAARSQGRGLVVTWAPQQTVLAHKATSFFLTHTGSNGVNEAIVNGVPMICWPGSFDQPWIALEMTVMHKVAYELIQVRQGFSVGRSLARGGPAVLGTHEAVKEEMVKILSDLNGPESHAMRERVVKLGQSIVQSLERGDSHNAMMKLGHIGDS